MFSIFNHAPTTVNPQQENNITARKPGLSTRKPFADRKLNTNVEESAAIKPKPVKTHKEPELTNDIMDFYSCSYKDTPETFSDFQESQDNISSIVFANVSSTPPPQKMHYSPGFQVNPDPMENYFDSIYDKIRSTLTNGLEQYDDSNLMDFDFDAVF